MAKKKQVRERKRKLYNYLPNLIITVIISFMLLGISLMIIADSVLIKHDTYTKSMKEQKVEEIAFDEIQTYFDQQYAYTGVDPETFKKSITRQQVTDAVYGYVEDTFAYITGDKSELPEYNIDFTLLEKNVDEDYKNWTEAEEVEYTDEVEKMKQLTIKNAEQTVTADLDVMMLSRINKPNGISTKLRKLFPYIRYGEFALGGAVLLMLIIMAAMNSKHLNGLLYWISTAVFCSSMLIMIPCALLKYTKYFDGLAIGNDTVYKSLTASLYRIDNSMLVFSAISFGVSVLFMIVYALTLTKPKKTASAPEKTEAE